jgi:hypothetical protein
MSDNLSTPIEQPEVVAKAFGLYEAAGRTDEELHPDSSQTEEYPGPADTGAYDEMPAPEGDVWRLHMMNVAQNYLADMSDDDLIEGSQQYHKQFVQLSNSMAIADEEQPCEHQKYRLYLLSLVCAGFRMELEVRYSADGCDDPDCDCNNN